MTIQRNRTLYLVNATSHEQSKTPWHTIDTVFHAPDFRPIVEVDPNKGIQRQCTETWRRLLNHVDALQEQDKPIDGFLLGGYAPIVLSLFQFLSGQRQRSFVAVMGEAPIKEGERRSFVLSDVRSIPTPRTLRKAAPEEGQPISEMDDLAITTRKVLHPIDVEKIDHNKLIHMSARPLDDARRATLKNLFPQTLIASAPVLPPAPLSDMEDFCFAIAELAELGHNNKCGFVFDGPPAESMLHLYSYISGTNLPCYYIKTAQPDKTKPAIPVGLERIPRF